MVDLADICGDDATLISLQKKKQKVLDKIAKIEEKTVPLRADIVMLDEMIAAILKRHSLGAIEVSSDEVAA